MSSLLDHSLKSFRHKERTGFLRTYGSILSHSFIAKGPGIGLFHGSRKWTTEDPRPAVQVLIPQQILIGFKLEELGGHSSLILEGAWLAQYC